MQSFRDPGGFQGTQQNFPQVRTDSARLETYRQQNSVAQTYESHGISSKEYYNQQTYQGYGSSAAGSYFSGTKQVSAQHPQGRSSNYQSAGYTRQFQSEGQPSKWGSPASSVGGLSQYVQDSFKGSAPSPTSVAAYQQQHLTPGGAQNPPAPHAHFLHQPHHKPLMQQASPYVPRPAHFNQAFQSSPSAYPAVQDYSHSSRSYEGFAQVAANSRYDPQSPATPDYSAQASYGYKAVAKSGGYEQNKVAHVKQQNLQYHNQAKLHLLNQSPQMYYQPDAPVKSPEQFYQTFSPTSTHSPVSTVVRSPSYSSSPSPLMGNPEALQFAPPSEAGSMAPDLKGNVAHLMPTAATSTGKVQADACKVFLKDSVPEKLLSDGAFSSLVALSSQVENIPRTVQQLLLSNTLAPHRKVAKRLPKKPELLKELKSPKESMYSEEALGAPQSLPTELQEGDHSSSSEDQMHFFQNHSGNLDALRKNLDTILACSLTSPNEVVAEPKALSGGGCSTPTGLSKLPADGQLSLFGKEDAKGSSVIILKDSFKERLETELKLNHPEGDKESKGSPLNLESAENFFSHLIRPKRSSQPLGSDCNEGRVKSDYPMGFGDDGCNQPQLFPGRTDSTSLLQTLTGDHKVNLVSPSCSSLVSSPSQDLEKLNLFDLSDKRGTEESRGWDGLEADTSDGDLPKPYLHKVGGNSKEQGLLETHMAPAQFAPPAADERGPEDGGDTTSQPRLLAAEQEAGRAEDGEPTEPGDSSAPGDHAAALAERKSVICDVSPTRPAAKELVPPLARGSCAGGEGKPSGGQTAEERAAGPRLLGHSVIHVGPAIVAEAKGEESEPPRAERNPPTDEVPEPAAAGTPDLPALSSDLISSALTEIENGAGKSLASRGPRVRRLSGRAAHGAGLRGKDHWAPDATQHLKMMPAKPRCLGGPRDRGKREGPASAEAPSRMCTRSSAALLDPELSLQSRALLRRRGGSQREDGPREAGGCSRQRSEADKCPGPRQGGPAGSSPPEPGSCRPLVLRARTRAQAVTLQREAKPRKNCDLAPARCFTARNNSRTPKQLSSRQEVLDYIEAADRLKTRNSASRLEAFPLSHPLKRKGYCSFPLIPAKRPHQMLKACESRAERPKPLAAHAPDAKPAAAPSSGQEDAPAPSCQGAAGPAGGTESCQAQADVAGQPGVSLRSLPKTKILPPRKGRGLKLEAIVQKITSPNSKSFACSNYSDGQTLSCLTLDDILSLREERLGETDPPPPASAEREPGAELGPKGLVASRRLAEESEWRGREKGAPASHARAEARQPRGTEAADPPAAEAKPLAAPDASPPLVPPEPVEPEGRQEPKTKGALLPAKRRGHPAASKAKGGCRSKRAGGRRRRKHLKGGKAAKSGHRRKKPLKRGNPPPVDSKEPVIRLKYVSYKVPRAGSKAATFSPYVRVEKSNAVYSVCTIINTLEEEQSRVQKAKRRWAPLSLSKALPTSSAMLPGPVVLDAARQGYLLCCLCGRAKNHKELGDLFGPYYPEDYVPPATKSPHVRGKPDATKEAPTRLPAEARAAESGGEGGGGGGGAAAPPPPPADPEDQSPLRTSSREKCKKLSCYCCEKAAGDTEAKRARRRVGAEEEAQAPELPLDPRERWLHGACAVWTSGVYLAAGKLYGLQEAVEMASEMQPVQPSFEHYNPMPLPVPSRPQQFTI
ncbi:retinoic acid-induced protein 1 isoform X2 [Narcine bancroftii]|uniref:retinoic acid-induced protein 1 isoform X2 n=1 Tax=Narcine bancroftii TaxID=1343680 RepID=UPI0038311BEA